MNSLAYVDLGASNGGIPLNVSEGGLALTAAAKLTGDELPRMRFQLPNLQDWIETQGRIVWLSESKKMAGVKFEELPADALQKIKKWISTQQCGSEERREHAAHNDKTLEPVNILKAPELPREPLQWQQPPNRDVPQPSGVPVPEFTMSTSDENGSVQHVRAMSKVPAPTTANRRVHARQRISSLAAYVDLGPANGGMLLNLGEGGLALTAAAKLVGDELPRVRFELPNLQDWIETHGRIIWLSESKKEAGVKFEELPADALTKIKNWISTECANEDRRQGTAQENKTLELIGAPRPVGLRQEPVVLPTFARDTDLHKERPPNTRFTVPLRSPVPVLFPSSEEQESIYGRSDRSIGSQPSERSWSWFAAIISFIALISFGAGILIERHFNQGFPRIAERQAAEVAQHGRDISDASGTLPAEKASLEVAQAHNLRKIASESFVAASSDRSMPPSTSSPLTLKPEGVAEAGTNPALMRREEKHSATARSVLKKQGSLAFEGTHPSAASAPPIVESNRGSATAPAPAPLAHRTDATKATSSLHEPVQPQLAGAAPRGGTASASQAVLAVNANKRPNLSPSTDVGANSSLASPSITITMPPFPSIRVPPQLKSQPSRLGTSLQMGQLASRVEPAYPPEAARQRIEGTVKLHATIGRDGAVQSVVATGPPLLAEAAMSAVRQWRYSPTFLGGQAIEADEDIMVVFRLLAQASTSN